MKTSHYIDVSFSKNKFDNNYNLEITENYFSLVKDFGLLTSIIFIDSVLNLEFETGSVRIELEQKEFNRYLRSAKTNNKDVTE